MAKTEEVIGYEFHRIFYADLLRRQVRKDGEPLANPLTDKEFELLQFFLERPATLVRREETPLPKFASRHQLGTHLSRIASKFDIDLPSIFKNKRPVGYEFVGDVHPVHRSDHQQDVEILAASEFNFNIHTVPSMRKSLSQTAQLTRKPHGPPEADITAAYDHINLCMAAYSAEIPRVGMPKARRKAQKALRKDPRSSRALGVLGLISMIYDYDLETAQNQLEGALDLNPNDAATLLSYAHFLVSTQHPDEAISAVKKASEKSTRVEAIDLIIHLSVGWIHLLAGKTADVDD